MTHGSRVMRFSGGPLHGEVREMREPLPRVFRVPISDFDPTAYVLAEAEADVSKPTFRVADYELTGDYPAEYFYRFRYIDPAHRELPPMRHRPSLTARGVSPAGQGRRLHRAVLIFAEHLTRELRIRELVGWLSRHLPQS